MKKLNISDMKTVELSIDQVGKILFYENRIFRAINDDYVDQVQDMFECGFLEEITSQKLFPKTWISDIPIEGYSLVLEHENIRHWNYPYEWSSDMLKDAGLVILAINKIANKYNYQIMDGHAYNVVFNMNTPQYVDVGSFEKIENSIDTPWKSYNIYFNHFYIPIYLWSKGYSDVARNIFLMSDYFSEKEFFKIKYPLINCNFIFNVTDKIKKISLIQDSKIRNKLANPIKQKTALFLKKLFKSNFSTLKLEKEIKNFTKPVEVSMWNDYHDNIKPTKNKRFIRIKEIIDNLEETTSLIEVASNQGKFAQFVLETTHLEKVIATDYDKEAVNIMYLNNKDKDNFLPLLFDMFRTNGRKSDDYIDSRIKCEIVVALAVTHHLILTQNIPIDYILNTMKKLTSKYIIVEFMPLGLYFGDLNNIPELPEFYTLEWFKENFLKYFDLILDEELEINRHLFVGSIKSEK